MFWKAMLVGLEWPFKKNELIHFEFIIICERAQNIAIHIQPIKHVYRNINYLSVNPALISSSRMVFDCNNRINSDSITGAIFLDLGKAFEIIPQNYPTFVYGEIITRREGGSSERNEQTKRHFIVVAFLLFIQVILFLFFSLPEIDDILASRFLNITWILLFSISWRGRTDPFILPCSHHYANYLNCVPGMKIVYKNENKNDMNCLPVV